MKRTRRPPLETCSSPSGTGSTVSGPHQERDRGQRVAAGGDGLEAAEDGPGLRQADGDRGRLARQQRAALRRDGRAVGRDQLDVGRGRRAELELDRVERAADGRRRVGDDARAGLGRLQQAGAGAVGRQAGRDRRRRSATARSCAGERSGRVRASLIATAAADAAAIALPPATAAPPPARAVTWLAGDAEVGLGQAARGRALGAVGRGPDARQRVGLLRPLGRPEAHLGAGLGVEHLLRRRRR